MKNFFLAIAITFSIASPAQKEKKSTAIPSVVKEAFLKEFPNQKAKWTVEKEGFEAEFTQKGNEVAAVYDNMGHRREFETEIIKDKLPSDVLPYMKKHYPTSKIKEAARITDDKNNVIYEVEISKEGKSFDLLFDEKGQFLKIEQD